MERNWAVQQWWMVSEKTNLRLVETVSSQIHHWQAVELLKVFERKKLKAVIEGWSLIVRDC